MIVSFLLLLNISCSSKELDTATSTTTYTEELRHACLSDQDCNGGACISYSGNNICQQEPEPWYHECTPEGFSECCNDEECIEDNNGSCVSMSYNYCGGVAPPEENRCHYDACQTNADCSTDKACLPKGIHSSIKNQCISASCTVDSDCTAGENGQCSVLWDGATCGSITLSCTYEGAACRRANGCENGNLCVADQSSVGASCQMSMPPP